MKSFVGALLIVATSFGMAFADAPAPVAAAAPKGESVAQLLMQLEHDWADAIKAGNADKVAQIVADDWIGIGFDGSKAAKKNLVEDVRSGKDKAESVDFGPMDVKVLGNVAIVQGSDTEKSVSNGKDSSGKWFWTDVFVKRNGQWLAVRSQNAMAK
jgi:ketosteroid isomerase-like protein